MPDAVGDTLGVPALDDTDELVLFVAVGDTVGVPALDDADELVLFDAVAVPDVVVVGVVEPVRFVDVAVGELLEVAVCDAETDAVVLGLDSVSEVVVAKLDVAVVINESVVVTTNENVVLMEGVVVAVMVPMETDCVMAGVVVDVAGEGDTVVVGVDGMVSVVVGDG